MQGLSLGLMVNNSVPCNQHTARFVTKLSQVSPLSQRNLEPGINKNISKLKLRLGGAGLLTPETDILHCFHGEGARTQGP